VLDSSPLHAHEQIAGGSVEPSRVHDRRLQFELGTPGEADLGGEWHGLPMSVIVVTIEFGARLDLDPAGCDRPRVRGN
jgi:hypothetical protein